MHMGCDVDSKLRRSSAQTKAPSNTPRAAARPTQNGGRGLQRLRARDGGCRANTQSDLQATFPSFNNM